MQLAKLKAVGYIRTSTKKQKWSPIVQREAIEKWAKEKNVELVDIVEVIGVSGGLPLVKRKNLLKAIRLVEENDAAILVTHTFDRLTRTGNYFDIEAMLKKCRARHVSIEYEEGGLEKELERDLIKGIKDSLAKYTEEEAVDILKRVFLDSQALLR